MIIISKQYTSKLFLIQVTVLIQIFLQSFLILKILWQIYLNYRSDLWPLTDNTILGKSSKTGASPQDDKKLSNEVIDKWLATEVYGKR